MSPADNDPTGPAPDGKKPSLGKRFLGRFGVSESTKGPASNNPTTRSMENLTSKLPNGKSPVKRFLSSLISSTPATHSMDHLTALDASAAHLAANIGVATVATVPEGAASIQVVTSTRASYFAISYQALTFYTAMGATLATIDQGSPVTPVAASSMSAINVEQRISVTPSGPTSATHINEHSSTTAVPNLVISENNFPARNPAPFMNDYQSAPPGPSVSQDQSKFKGELVSDLEMHLLMVKCPKEGVDVALDGILTVLRVTKEASDWNPFLKAALGGVVAVVDLAKTMHSNSRDMKDILDRIQGLLPILETSAKRLEGRKDDFGRGNNLMTFAITMQTELEKIQQMQLHGVFRCVLQGPKDVGALLGIYKNISEALEQFKVSLLLISSFTRH
ncbi:hypothetical protein DXG01_013550 [Tephrocybe rancida]|nr:hypothetical protein DXG01_013550 [Tephrocybe rancida]